MQELRVRESRGLSYSREDWKRGYESQPNEYDYWVDEIEGEIPPGLQGTLFRNGPGLFDIHGVPVQHPFDGDGMVCAVTFLPDGRVHPPIDHPPRFPFPDITFSTDVAIAEVNSSVRQEGYCTNHSIPIKGMLHRNPVNVK